jgi:deoxyribodipyrimidine photolyase-related protein
MEVIKAAEQSYKKGHVSLASAEGFIRQILGWREYVRGVYFHFMPEYIARNFLKADEDLPPLYWNAKTEMNCMRDVVTQTMNFGYAHHIQRLMVTGLFSLLYGVRPTDIHQWYLAVYVDAVEWVELPNTLGMSQYGDGGVMASKPYIASGKYISRMSNYCKGCKYSPEESTGPNACPFTTFYWDFIRKHQTLISKNPRLAMQVKNWQKLGSDKQKEIELTAKNLRKNIKKGNI